MPIRAPAASAFAIGLSSAAPADMAVSYHTTDATNALTGTADTPVSIAASTFSAFLVGDSDLGLTFFPSEYRLRIVFADSNGNVVGSTSVALNSDTPASAGTEPVGYGKVISGAMTTLPARISARR